ncbi:MAG: hypothetical protein QNK37_13790 [Acidobacteriota bacterium]|nr:hypothetical protein [Acidobacteriota bacterium]
MKTLYLEIQKDGTRYNGRVHRGDPHHAATLPGALSIGPGDMVDLGGKEYTWKDLGLALLNHHPDRPAKAYEERGQLLMGRELYKRTLDLIDFPDEPCHLVIVTEDENIKHLPWPLLRRSGFLINRGWTVSLASDAASSSTVELPPNPKTLAVLSDPVDESKTLAEQHEHELRLLLEGTQMLTAGRFRAVRTWDEFREACTGFQPDVVYFYGHGKGDRSHCDLVFEDRARRADPRPLVDVVEWLARTNPLLVYVNCCSGDSAGLLGAGQLMGTRVPAVITNRTVVTVSAARAQGTALWDHLLLRGEDPRTAVAQNFFHLADLEATLSKPHWFTPVIHAHFRTWKAERVLRRPRFGNRGHDPHWELKVDRVEQFSVVSHMTQEMLLEGKPRGLAFLWYGKRGQGMVRFGERLALQLRDFLKEAQLYQVDPVWPAYSLEYEGVSPGFAFEDMMMDAFEVDDLNAVPARIRTQTRGNRALVYLNHPLVTSRETLSPNGLELYLDWLGRKFLPLLESPTQFALIGLSFQLKKPDKFRKRIDRINPEGLVFRPLRELDSLIRRDLEDFLRTHNIYVPRGATDKLLEKILEDTGGHYETTLSHLEKLILRGPDVGPEETDDDDDDDDDGF